ncbi:MAG: RluA family pseudouridine synthase [Peptoniphilaceae bacterium]
MREILVNKNDAGQRIDRFLKKYLKKASLSFIYKNLRKKNITLNGKKAKPEDTILEGDKIKLFLSEETIKKFIKEEVNLRKGKFPTIIYEDENIILLDKKVGVLSHNDSSDYQLNMLDMMVDYLIAKGDYHPRVEKTFRPALCNRLDRNTSGILIGAKNAQSLRELNKEIRENNIKKYYLTLVKGKTPKEFEDHSYLLKDQEKNKVSVSSKSSEGSKDSLTKFETIIQNNDYSLLKVDLITGRTHQIRTVLKSKNFPIVGDTKYGQSNINNIFIRDYSYKSQFLHNFMIEFKELSGSLSYLSNKKFYNNLPSKEESIIGDIFGDRNVWRK